MASPLDIGVATTLARAARTFRTTERGAAAGLEFECALYEAVLSAHDWQYATPPDQFDLGLQIATRTGVRYEHDGMVASADTLYTLEAKWLTGPVTREIVGILVMKLLDTLLGSHADIGHFAIKPVIVAGKGGADNAAFLYAAAFGVLLVTLERPTPFEILDSMHHVQAASPVTNHFRQECETLGGELWRPFNNLVRSGTSPSSFYFAADNIYDTHRTVELMEHWNECQQTAQDLRLIASAPVLSARETRR